MSSTIYYKNLGTAIKMHRIKAGISRKELAMLLNVTPSLIAKWENNYRTPKNLLEPLCKFLFISPEELYESCKYNPNKRYRFTGDTVFVILGALSIGGLIYSLVSLIMLFCFEYEITNIIDNNENKIVQYFKLTIESDLKFYSATSLIALIIFIIVILAISFFVFKKSRKNRKK